MFTALVASLLACGSEVSYNGHEPVPVLPPDAAPPLEGCTEPLLVPRGPSWVGAMEWHNGNLVPNACDAMFPGSPGFRVTVPDFFLDTDEVTNACYAHCVDAGTCAPPKPVTREAPAWDDDARRQYPARLLDRAMAEAFCAWRGGRLPSLAEMGRAEHGGAVAVMNADLTQLWRDCAAAPQPAPPPEPKPEKCGEIWERIYGESTPVRDWELDRGPYGHYDLALSALEFTMTHMWDSKDELEALCSLSLNPDTIDPKTLGSGRNMGFRHGVNLDSDVVEGEGVGWAITGDPLEGGVRCAYDPI